MFDSVAFDQIFANVAVYKDHYMSVMGMRFHTLDFVCILLFIACVASRFATLNAMSDSYTVPSLCATLSSC